MRPRGSRAPEQLGMKWGFDLKQSKVKLPSVSSLFIEESLSAEQLGFDLESDAVSLVLLL